ncbi:MAG: hypothetical protein KDE58_21195, partial [Caldilineaceae bacterium]|nr:hypothetical protein [Caldilineaceae bacterium]
SGDYSSTGYFAASLERLLWGKLSVQKKEWRLRYRLTEPPLFHLPMDDHAISRHLYFSLMETAALSRGAYQ